jgi:insertion element IS1 protein InsB
VEFCFSLIWISKTLIEIGVKLAAGVLDEWGAYSRHLEVEKHKVGKQYTQKVKTKHINLRTRIKRLVRRTICFSKTERMHDIVVGLLINRHEFGVEI